MYIYLLSLQFSRSTADSDRSELEDTDIAGPTSVRPAPIGAGAPTD